VNLLTHSQAKTTGMKYFFTGVPCKNGHVDKRSVANRTCYSCQLQKSQTFRDKNPDYHTQYNAQYELTSDQKKRNTELHRMYRVTRPSEIDAVHSAYRARNRKALTQKSNEWARDNKGKKNALTAKRRSANKTAVAKRANIELMQQVYIDCEQVNTLSRMYGVTDLYVVDHVVPLQGKTVCGLHVENNLQLVLSSYNAQKHNKLVIQQ
jgi:hypothetical protein